MAANYNDVLDQLRGSGLVVADLQIGRMARCRVEGDREKRGWYMLHELQLTGGDLVLVGSFGVWHGADNGAQKIALRKVDAITSEQREALKRRLVEDRKRVAAERARDAERAARRAASAWARYDPTGESEYLARKGVGAYGLRFTAGGAAVLPLLDTAGKMHGLQFLRTAAQAKERRRPTKEFWPVGVVKKGHFHLVGTPQHVVLVAEGYATAASLHMATGYPVAVAFDAGNLGPVAVALHKRHPRARILICADDDDFQKCRECDARLVLSLNVTDCPGCGKPHRTENAGINNGSAAALSVNGAMVSPRFVDEDARRNAYLDNGRKLTDFNDLHTLEGLHVVRTQVEARLSELQWSGPSARGASTLAQGGGAGEKLRPLTDIDELLKRYALVYAHSSAAFDRQEHILVTLSDMRDACVRRDLHRGWAESPERDIVRIREVGFDPTGQDPQVTCNLYGGWPTTPQSGKCDKLLDLLRFMCSGDRNPEALYNWVLKWIAYPIQHPGAKMKTTLVLHGPQGTGKNLFFEALMSIYGEYADVIDQSSVEDKFNDWASRKLFMIADEVIARSDLYHVKNKLKALITGERIRINPKNFAAYWERNHLNLVFLSNETMPVVLEEDDRRHVVIWTPPPLQREFYADVLAEIAAGGVAALHDHLLHLDLGDFSAGARPPLTIAKLELIGLALDSPMRFYDDVLTGDMRLLQPMPALTTDWYEAYKIWCTRSSQRPAPMHKFVNALSRKRGCRCERKRYINGQLTRGPHGVLFMGPVDAQDGESELHSLGQSIATFRDLLADFRGGAS